MDETLARRNGGASVEVGWLAAYSLIEFGLVVGSFGLTWRFCTLSCGLF